MKPSSFIAPRFLWALALLALGRFIPAGVAQTASPVPELSLSLRGVADGSIEEKEPFSVAVRVDAPGSADASLVLAPATGTWIEATVVEIAASADGPALATARPAAVTGAAAPARLTYEKPATGLWWFPPESVSNLSAGNYLVRARLAINDGSGWKGSVVAEPISLRTVAASNDPARVTQRTLARARAAALGGQLSRAAEILDAALAGDANNVPLLGARAAVSLGLGQRWGAQSLVQRALLLSRQQAGEPSHELHSLAEQIERSLLSETSASPTPPARPAPSSAPAASAPSSTPAATPSPAGTASAPPVPSPATSPVTTTPAAAGGAGPGTVVPSGETVEAAILSDPAGQWIASAAAGSEYEKTITPPPGWSVRRTSRSTATVSMRGLMRGGRDWSGWNSPSRIPFTPRKSACARRTPPAQSLKWRLSIPTVLRTTGGRESTPSARRRATSHGFASAFRAPTTPWSR